MTSDSKLSPHPSRQRSSSRHKNFPTPVHKLYLVISLSYSSVTITHCDLQFSTTKLYHEFRLHIVTMPIPTADYTSQEKQLQNAAGSTCSTGQADLSSFAALDGNAPHLDTGVRDASAPQNEQGDRPLSKEEADRLYEERMEDEYAKREGGA